MASVKQEGINKKFNIWDVAGWIVIIFCIGVAATICSQTYLDPDLSLHVETAKRMLAGERLYDDIFEVNLPMTRYWVMPAIVLSSIIDVNVMLVLAAYNITIGILCLVLCLRILTPFSRYADEASYRFAMRFGLAYAIFLVPFLFAKNAFGEKPHVFFMLFLPYVCLWLVGRESVSVRMRCVVSVLAAVGVCMKPFYVIFLLVLWGRSIADQRSFAIIKQVEFLVVALVGVVYMLSFWLLYPSYLTDVLPMAKAYAAYAKLVDPTVLFVKAGLIIVPVCLLYNSSKKSSVTVILMLMVLAAVVQVLLQYSRWHYVMIPAIAFSTVVGVIFLHDGLRYFVDNILRVKGAKADNADMLPLVAGVVFVVFLFVLMPKAVEGIYSGHESVEKLGEVVEDDMFMLTPNMQPLFPAISYQNVGVFNSTFSGLSVVDGLAAMGNSSEARKFKAEGEKRIRKQIVEDFLRISPRKVLVRHAFVENRASAPHYYINFLLEDERFSERWKGYKFLGVEQEFFYIYERVETATKNPVKTH